MTADTSLYDYLGRAAGPKLGGFVAKVAHELGHQMERRHVTQGNYDGLVNLYTRKFLDWFFNEPTFKSQIEEDKKEFREKQIKWFKENPKNKN